MFPPPAMMSRFDGPSWRLSSLISFCESRAEDTKKTSSSGSIRVAPSAVMPRPRR